ncbi:MAG: hypothetical protein KAI83_13650 [Thiomargarita sp.]|nr:hypothetical protein [Thiomargarita sp.]
MSALNLMALAPARGKQKIINIMLVGNHVAHPTWLTAIKLRIKKQFFFYVSNN